MSEWAGILSLKWSVEAQRSGKSGEIVDGYFEVTTVFIAILWNHRQLQHMHLSDLIIHVDPVGLVGIKTWTDGRGKKKGKLSLLALPYGKRVVWGEE